MLREITEGMTLKSRGEGKINNMVKIDRLCVRPSGINEAPEASSCHSHSDFS